MFENERRDLSFVPRWSILRVHHRQSVAEHSYYVCAYGLEIAKRIDWPAVETDQNDYAVGYARYRLALYLLRHDEAESVTSDVPGPIKRLTGMDESKLFNILDDRYGELERANVEMQAIKKAADLLDECMYLSGELALGNTTVWSVLGNSLNLLNGAVAYLPGASDAKAKLYSTLTQAIAAEQQYDKNVAGLGGV